MPAKTMNFNTEAGAIDYMLADATKKGCLLAYGAGNDMKRPFYTRRNAHTIDWWPDGHDGDLFVVGFHLRLSEYNPGFESSRK